MYVILGMVMLKVNSVKKGHEGEYRCVFQSKMATIRYNTVEVRVSDAEGDNRTPQDDKNQLDISQLLSKGKVILSMLINMS